MSNASAKRFSRFRARRMPTALRVGQILWLAPFKLIGDVWLATNPQTATAPAREGSFLVVAVLPDLVRALTLTTSAGDRNGVDYERLALGASDLATRPGDERLEAFPLYTASTMLEVDPGRLQAARRSTGSPGGYVKPKAMTRVASWIAAQRWDYIG